MSFRSFALLCLLLPASSLAQLEGVIDLHVHSAPDSVPRSVTAIEAAQLGVRHQMRAMLLKNHYSETASLAYIVGRVVPGIELYGGIALNRSIGGVNPTAVDRMARLTGGRGRVVWMPTFDSVQWQVNNGANPLFVPVSRDGKLLPEVLEVLDVIAKHGLSLATGHSSPAESLMIIEAAKNRGIERILVTHPFISAIGMDVATQKKAAAMGALLEYPFNATLPPFGPRANAPMADHLKAIRDVGPEHVVISSDLGQQGNPVHPDGLITFIQALQDDGFTAAEIRTMTQTNPAKFLGLQ
jgi:hypothetical protein